MMTALIAYVLINLTTGQPLGAFTTEEECVANSYRVSFVTGQETRCEAVYRITH